MKRVKTLLTRFFLPFVIPLAIVVLGCIALHITPFGDHTFVISDANALYVSDLSYFSRFIQGKEGLIYSFESGIGMNQAGLLSTILNPVNLVVLLFDITDFASMYTWVIAVSISLSGLTMHAFLVRMRPVEDASNLVFSTAYSLMGFNVAYCFLYSFLIHAALLPLIALGIRKILIGERPWLYFASLSYCMLLSYYFGYMLCIAAGILSLLWLLEQNSSQVSLKRPVITLIGCTVCSVVATAVIWLPSLLSIVGGRLEQNSLFDLTFDENMGTFDAAAKLFAGANSTQELKDGLPNIFVGAFPVFLVTAFFADARVSLRKKICRATALIFYILTFYIKALSMAMQGFSETNWFNYRYSFVFSFLMLITAAEQYSRLRDMDRRDFGRSLAAYVTLALFAFATRHEYVSGGSLLLACAVLGLCLLAVAWSRSNPIAAPAGQLAVLLIILCSVELYANFCLSMYSIQDWEAKADTYQADLFFYSVYSDAVNDTDDDLYRMVNENPSHKRCDNDPRLFGYRGTSYFGSQERNFVFQGMAKLGQPWYGNRTWYAEGLPKAYDALMGIRYVVSRRDLSAEKGYKACAGSEREIVYRNQQALPFVVVSRNVNPLPDMGPNPFDNLNKVWRNVAGGRDNVLESETDLEFTFHDGMEGERLTSREALANSNSISASIGNALSGTDTSEEGVEDSTQTSEGANVSPQLSTRFIECSFTARKDGAVYSYKGAAVDKDTGYALEAMQYLGTYKKGDLVVDRIYILDDDLEVTKNYLSIVCSQYYVAYENQDVLARYAHEIQEASGTIERVSDDHLTGHVDAKEEGRLFFTIPYDEGWTLTVDGAEVPLEMDAGLFMSAPVAAGEHDWEMRFVPVGLVPGAAMSAVGLALAAVLAVLDRRRRREGGKGAGPALPEGEVAA